MPGIDVMECADAPVSCGCYVKQLPERLREAALDTARAIYPANAPGNLILPEGVMAPQHLAILTTKYWGPTPRTLTVSFLEPRLAGPDLQRRILGHMNAWQCCITFVPARPGKIGNVRISLTGNGFWSYLGTDILHIPNHMPTMNLQNFSMRTSEEEYKRVVRHETGHTLGFPHEHLRRDVVGNIDPEKAYDYFRRNGGWSKKMVDQNVLIPVDENSIMGTPEADVASIMCYQLPGEITKDGEPIPGGLDINQSDFRFCHQLYPPRAGAQENGDILSNGAVHDLATEDWGPNNDVDIKAKLRRFTEAAADGC